MVPANDDTYTHAVFGPVHEVAPKASSEALRTALEHELEACDAVRIVVDLTAIEDLDDEYMAIMVELIDPHDERWMLRLGHDVDDEVVARLCDAGFDGHLIGDDEANGPRHLSKYED